MGGFRLLPSAGNGGSFCRVFWCDGNHLTGRRHQLSRLYPCQASKRPRSTPSTLRRSGRQNKLACICPTALHSLPGVSHPSSPETVDRRLMTHQPSLSRPRPLSTQSEYLQVDLNLTVWFWPFSAHKLCNSRQDEKLIVFYLEVGRALKRMDDVTGEK